MNMGVEIKRVLQDLGRVTIDQVFHEAIMNSIQANAKNISINVQYRQLSDKSPKLIEKVSIIDDGDGFNETNTKSFETYKTTLKQSFGAKGVGRFLYLKLFESVSIESLNKNIFFNTEDVEVKPAQSLLRKDTEITFTNPLHDLILDVENIKEEILEHFLPYFHLYDGKTIKISMVANGNNIFQITSKDIPSFETSSFQIENHKFCLSYALNVYKSNKNNGFYCADDRVVIKNNKDNKPRLKSFGNLNFLFLLSSEYLNSTVNETRDDFEINPKRSPMSFEHLSWEEIQKGVSQTLKKIFLNNGIDVDERSKHELNDAIMKAPYLSNYLEENPYGYDSSKLIDNAEKRLKKDKEILRNKEYKNEIEFTSKLAKVTQSELAEYIYDRQKIIDKLKAIINPNILEKEVHNLFLKQKINSELVTYKNNNLWLFDDRFMVYDKVFSEEQIRNIFPSLSNILSRPDILSIVSNSFEKEEITDIVIIEFKRPNESITPAGAEEQLLEYARHVNNSSENKNIRIWCYAFLTFNSETCLKLQDKSYNIIPTQSEYPIYYKHHGSHNVIINFMDYKALADDANTRNKTFMQILTNTVH